MTPAQEGRLCNLLASFFADRPRESVSTWCERELRFDEPDNRGPFTLSGSEYIREPLDCWADPAISDIVLCWASQVRKTGMIMGGSCWTIEHEPTRLFWVMPTRDKVRSFSATRWIPMLRRSPAMVKFIPTGARRHDFSKLEQILGGSIVDFVWSNSPAALSSDPARVVVLDEVDKFASGGGQEADAVNLAEQRTKDKANPKRVATSTPTLTDGLIWQKLLTTDMRRRFVPCPFCPKSFVIAWSKDYTVFKLTGEEAFVTWDKEAKRADGTWDLDRVERSARITCPHCAGHIRDGHKTKMDREGVWRPTQPGRTGSRGYHLPGMNSSAPENALGKMAMRFLTSKQGLLGLQGFVNGDLAEPWENQEARSERIEIIAPEGAAPLTEATPILTADYQLLAPKIWFIARTWKGDSRLLDFGPLDGFEQLRAKQIEHGILDHHVGIDSGHDAEEVYANCLRFGKLQHRPNDIPLWVGWTPMKGFDRRDQWQDPKTKQPRPFNLGSAALPHRRFRLPLLEFSTNHIKDMFERLRIGKTRFKWELIARCNEEYFKHLDAELKKPFYHPQTRRVRNVWVKRSRAWPDHLRDGELMSLVKALFHHAVSLGEEADS